MANRGVLVVPALVATAAPSVMLGSEPDPWIFAAAEGPTAGGSQASVFDRNRQRAVFFGGVPEAQTWEWDGVAWTRIMVAGPGARSDHAMAFDTKRGVTVLFGGTGGGGWLRDTWEWDGSTWTFRTTSGPSSRGQHAMAFDSVRAVTVLVGGEINSAIEFGDTWEWDGTVWVQREGLTPGRARPALAFDEHRGKLVLFGGRNFTDSLGDTWERSGTTWVQVSSAGPSPRHGAQMTYDVARGLTVLMGGGTLSPGATARLSWEWNGTQWRSTNDNPPLGRLTYDTVREQIVSLGQVRCGDPLWGTWVRPSSAVDFCYANCDGSTAAPILNVNDFICFVGSFAERRGYANCDGSSAPCSWNVTDFHCFMTQFATGCP